MTLRAKNSMRKSAGPFGTFGSKSDHAGLNEVRFNAKCA